MSQDASLKPAHQRPETPDFWDKRFAEGVTPWSQGGVPVELEAFAAGQAGQPRTLIPGCGHAWEAGFLANRGWQVTALDFSPAAIDKAREILGDWPGELLCADFFNFAPAAPYDIVYERAFLCALPRKLWPGYGPRLAELLLRESNEILRVRMGSVIVEHKLGFVCANAGIDHSNVAGNGTAAEEWVLLLPENPDQSAAEIRSKLEVVSGKKLGVMIIDSHGRAWRLGTVGVAIGLSGLPGLIDERGWRDLFGYTLQITVLGAADELAAAASLVMGQAAEGTPVVHVRGFPYELREASLNELLRPKEQDLFR